MKLKAVVVLVMLSDACANHAHGQLGVLRGNVADSSSGIALSRASVTVVAAPGTPLKTVLTDAGGHFRFTGLAQGRYTLIIQRIGYRRDALRHGDHGSLAGFANHHASSRLYADRRNT